MVHLGPFSFTKSATIWSSSAVHGPLVAGTLDFLGFLRARPLPWTDEQQFSSSFARAFLNVGMRPMTSFRSCSSCWRALNDEKCFHTRQALLATSSPTSNHFEPLSTNPLRPHTCAALRTSRRSGGTAGRLFRRAAATKRCIACLWGKTAKNGQKPTDHKGST